MSDKSDTPPCPCGGVLLSKADCLASTDEVLRYVGEAYLDDESGYCPDEDDVVPYAWARGEHPIYNAPFPGALTREQSS